MSPSGPSVITGKLLRAIFFDRRHPNQILWQHLRDISMSWHSELVCGLFEAFLSSTLLTLSPNVAFVSNGDVWRYSLAGRGLDGLLVGDTGPFRDCWIRPWPTKWPNASDGLLSSCLVYLSGDDYPEYRPDDPMLQRLAIISICPGYDQRRLKVESYIAKFELVLRPIYKNRNGKALMERH